MIIKVIYCNLIQEYGSYRYWIQSKNDRLFPNQKKTYRGLFEKYNDIELTKVQTKAIEKKPISGVFQLKDYGGYVSLLWIKDQGAPEHH